MASPMGDDGSDKEMQLRIWEGIIRLDPASPALLPLVRIRLAQNEPEAAHELASRIGGAHPHLLEAIVLSARALLDMGNLEQACLVLARAGEVFDHHAKVFREMSDVLIGVGEADRAEVAARAAEILAGREDWPDAASFADDDAPGDRLPVDQPVPTETLAGLYLKQGHIEQAGEIYRLLLHEDPDNERIKSALAQLERSVAEEGPRPGPEEEVETRMEETAALSAVTPEVDIPPLQAAGEFADENFETTGLSRPVPDEAESSPLVAAEDLGEVDESGADWSVSGRQAELWSVPAGKRAGASAGHRLARRLEKLRNAARRRRQAVEGSSLSAD